MSTLSSLSTSASALTAQRLRMDVIAGNVANADTTRTPSGGPYRRHQVVLTGQAPDFARALSASSRPGYQLALTSAGGGHLLGEAGGVTVSGIVQDASPSRLVYEPGHPDANADGYVSYPNVDVGTEMADMLSATRAYEANVTVINAAKSMAQKALELVGLSEVDEVW